MSARQPRVMMVIRLFSPWLGGTQSQARRLARELIDRGIDVQLVTGRWFRGTPRRERIDGIPVVRNHALWEGFGIRGARTVGGYVYLLTLLWHLWRRRRTYDVIHVHGLSYHTFASALAGRWFAKPTVVKLANSGPASDLAKMRASQHLPLARTMLPTALRCDRFVALNPSVERELFDAGLSASRIVRIANGIDPGPVPDRSGDERGRPIRVLYVGRLHGQKGVDVLLRAAALISARTPRPDVRFAVVGDGPLEDELTALAHELGVAELVRFHGRRDDVDAFLRAADVFVLPSRAEGMSNALLEAMAAGLAVVASAVPGNTEVVEHERDGLLVEPEDAAALAAAILRLHDDPALRRELGRRARDTIESTYAIGLVADRYVALYRELLSASRAGAAPPVADARKVASGSTPPR